jgi:hypothetical protein
LWKTYPDEYLFVGGKRIRPQVFSPVPRRIRR